MKVVKLLWFSLALMAMVVLSTAQKNRPEGRRECLHCVSYTSWADCYSSAKNGKCREGEGGCVKFQSGGVFIAACANLQLCGEICKYQENCEVECCSEDLCNGGSKPEPEGRSPQLQCLECVNSSSWADCVSSGQNVQCAAGLSNCAKIRVGESITATCASPQFCEDMCKGQEDCDIECCSEDMCNNVTTPEPEGRSQQLECLECVNSSSWAACVSSGQNVQCAAGLSSCAKIRVDGAFTATCASPQLCENMCEGDEDCDIECCSEDLCNGGKSAPKPEGHIIQCLECMNSSSWAECVSSGKNVQCPEFFTNCAKIRVGPAFTAGRNCYFPAFLTKPGYEDSCKLRECERH